MIYVYTLYDDFVLKIKNPVEGGKLKNDELKYSERTVRFYHFFNRKKHDIALYKALQKKDVVIAPSMAEPGSVGRIFFFF